jgi:glycyl-tRNA synthetase beta subunit
MPAETETVNETLDARLHQQIEDWFTYHAPKGNQPERYQRLRAAAKQLAREIAVCCPKSADQNAAFRKLREAVFTANAAIALEPVATGLDG